jgi:hypothetical protein
MEGAGIWNCFFRIGGAREAVEVPSVSTSTRCFDFPPRCGGGAGVGRKGGRRHEVGMSHDFRVTLPWNLGTCEFGNGGPCDGLSSFPRDVHGSLLTF